MAVWATSIRPSWLGYCENLILSSATRAYLSGGHEGEGGSP